MTTLLSEAADDFRGLMRRHEQQEKATETGASVAWEVRPRRSTELVMASALAALPREGLASGDFNPGEILASLAAPKVAPLFGRNVVACGEAGSVGSAPLVAGSAAAPPEKADGSRQQTQAEDAMLTPTPTKRVAHPPSARKTNRKLELGSLPDGDTPTPGRSGLTKAVASAAHSEACVPGGDEALKNRTNSSNTPGAVGPDDAHGCGKSASDLGAAAWKVKKNWGTIFPKEQGKIVRGGSSGSSPGSSSGNGSAKSSGGASPERRLTPAPIERPGDALKKRVRQPSEVVTPRVAFDSAMTTPSGLSRVKSLHDKLMSPERKKKSPTEAAAAAAAKQARASEARERLDLERRARLAKLADRHRQAEEWQEVRRSRLKAQLDHRESSAKRRHEQHLAELARKAGEVSKKVSEVVSMRSLEVDSKRLSLQQKLEKAEARREEARRSREEEARQRMEAAAIKRQALEEGRKAKLAAKKAKKEEAAAKAADEHRAMLALAAEVRVIKERRVAAAQAARPADEMARIDRMLAARRAEATRRRRKNLELIHQHAEACTPESGQAPTTPTGGAVGPFDDAPCSLEAQPAEEDTDAAAKRLREERKKKAKRIRQRMVKIPCAWVEPPAADAAAAAAGGAKVRLQKAATELQRAAATCSNATQANYFAVTAAARELVRCLPAALSFQRVGSSSESKLPPGRIAALRTAAENELHLVRRCGALEAAFTALAAVAPASGARARDLDDSDGSAGAAAITAEAAVLCLGIPENAAYVRAKHIFLPIAPLLASELDATCEGGAAYVECRPRRSDPVAIRARSSSTARSSSSTSGPECPTTQKVNNNADPTLLEALLALSDSVLARAPRAAEASSRSSDEEGQDPARAVHNSLVNYVVSFGIVHRLRELFAVWERPQEEGSPVPSAIEWGLRLLGTLCGSAPCRASKEIAHLDTSSTAPVLRALGDTHLGGLPSLLTATLLHAAPGLGAAAADADKLPPNFVPVATTVMRILNSAARRDHCMVQQLLGSTDMRMELFHLVSFLLSFCTAAWTSRPAAPGMRQGGIVAELLEEVIVLISFFARGSPKNQAVLTWGRAPTILTKLCNVPFPFFSDPALKPLLLRALHAASSGNAKSRDVLAQELGSSWLCEVEDGAMAM